MVQAARLDLIRIAATALLAALASNGAFAQPLLQEGPLTTLLQPQKLDRSRPLLHQDGGGTGSADPATNRATPCTRQGRAAGAAPSAFGGGSGPGDYGQYMPNAPSSNAMPPTTSTGPTTSTASTRPGAISAPAGSTPPGQIPGVDRPLYGGTDRPLWETGAPRQSAAGKPVQSSDTDKTAGAAPASASPAGTSPNGTAPARARDRPLWADGSVMASTDPAAGAGIAPAPCIDPAPIPR